MTKSTIVGCIPATRQHLTKISISSFHSSFDVDLPVDCDDEYWDHPDPEQRFKQPENKPSLISAFILYIKLNQILSKCLTIVSLFILHFTVACVTNVSQHTIKQSKILSGYIRQQWEQDIVAQLDSSLNQWVDTIPDHRTFSYNCRFFLEAIYLPFASRFFQCDGIPIGKTPTFSTSRRVCMSSIIIFKFSSTVHTSPNLHLFLILPWLFAPMPRDRVAILLT